MTGRKKAAEPKFEKDLETLEKIVGDLEEGGLSLDVSLKKFEEGIRIAQRCEKALSSAEKKIEVLTQNAAGALTTKPFGDEEEDVGDAEEEGGEGEDVEEEDDDGEMLF